MPALKNINVTIFKYVPHCDGTQSAVLFQSVAVNTPAFAPEQVAALMLAVTGHVCDDEDHCFLNDLHVNGKCAFKFGGDWEYYLEAAVTYPA